MKRFILITAFLPITWLNAQTLPELLKQAEQNYPLLKAKGYEVQARKEQVAFAKSTVLPSLDGAYQINYATYNNITGMAVGQSFVPISGPPSPGNSYNGVFGSAAGLLLNWDPFTFGQRSSRIESAKAVQSYQEADEALEIFQHQVRVVQSYLDVMWTQELTRVYAKNLERAQENARVVQSLVQSGLRPGVDTSLFNAELSKAKIDLLTYEKQREITIQLLSELLGGENATITVDTLFFNTIPNVQSEGSLVKHPLIQLSSSRLNFNQQERISLQRTLLPKLSFWGTAYARGSGIRYNGNVNSEDGLSFSRYNYGAGLVLSVPLLRFTNVRHQVNAQESIIKAEEERMNLVKLQLAKQNEVATVTFNNALQIANESPVFYNAAEFSFRTLRSRYNSGLVNYADLVQSQYGLLKSEVDMKKAYLDAWKALLYRAAVQGDITIFLNQLN